MITRIEVNGFKSLGDFHLKPRAGLNILVGPNGAGKTNIVQFFEWLSHLVSNPISNSISRMGGAGAIFQKIGKDKYVDMIRGKIHGCTETQKRFAIYEYEFDVRTSNEKDNVYFSRQEFRAGTASAFWEDPNSKNFITKWDIDIRYFRKDDGRPQVDVSFVKEKINRHFLPSSPVSVKDIEVSLKKYVKNQYPLFNCLISMLFPITDYVPKIFLDLKGGESFNIIPSKVRELEDSASPPGIKKDGSGLATTLYAMRKGRAGSLTHDFDYFSFFEEPKNFSLETFERIVSYLKIANPNVDRIDVENDHFSNKLVAKAFIKAGNYSAALPLALMSDGTIKWLALTTAILTSRSVFSIEEPENFIHPWMQAEIVNIIRESLQEKKSRSFVIVTTHSESLLNRALPEEIILVKFTDGKTGAVRIKDINEMKEEISKSGFGLGHFYFSNALTNE